jgi:2-oxoisovalerate dehydrogenase E2 component (dihydrolipoyl transacylase)
MSEYVFKLPDLGEGTVEAEIVEWHVRPGDEVNEGDLLVDVMTEKASVEVPAPLSWPPSRPEPPRRRRRPRAR